MREAVIQWPHLGSRLSIRSSSAAHARRARPPLGAHLRAQRPASPPKVAGTLVWPCVFKIGRSAAKNSSYASGLGHSVHSKPMCCSFLMRGVVMRQ